MISVSKKIVGFWHFFHFFLFSCRRLLQNWSTLWRSSVQLELRAASKLVSRNRTDSTKLVKKLTGLVKNTQTGNCKLNVTLMQKASPAWTDLSMKSSKQLLFFQMIKIVAYLEQVSFLILDSISSLWSASLKASLCADFKRPIKVKVIEDRFSESFRAWLFGVSEAWPRLTIL